MKEHFFAGAILLFSLGCGQEGADEPCNTSSTGVCELETAGDTTDDQKKFGVCELDQNLRCKPEPVLTYGVCELGTLGCGPDHQGACQSNFWLDPITLLCSGPIGARDQACTNGGACDPGLKCEEGMCICPDGGTHCWCKDGAVCNEGLVCEGNICWPEQKTP